MQSGIPFGKTGNSGLTREKSMRRTPVIATAVALFLFAGAGWADEKQPKTPDTEALYAKLAQAPVGVYKATIAQDKAGRIQWCLIVGRSRMSAPLGKAQGV